MADGRCEDGLVREAIRDLVEAVNPHDALEAEHREDVLSWLESDVEIFRTAKPATPPKHLVSYCVLVDRDGEHVLLVDHRDAQRWLPAGGHIEPGEHPVDAARREVNEELRISPPFHRGVGEVPLFVTVTRTGGRSASHTDVSLWFVFEASTDEAVSADEGEFVGVRWWQVNDIRPCESGRFDPHLPRFVEKLRRHVC
jgi:8-oxo-dGTP pyrophosphatase MutT (NUDIX family)